MGEFVENSEDLEVVYLDDFESQMVEGILAESEDLEENVQEITDMSILTFSKHTKSVFCGDVTKNGQLAVTGGEDDCAFVWLHTTGEVKFECTGHKDSITCACFNHNGQFLATGDMSGMIQVWEVATQKLVWCFEGDDLEWLFWHLVADVLLAGTQAGEVYIWQIPQGNCKVLASHGSSCLCGKLLPNGKEILAGYEDGTLKLWDIKATSFKWQSQDADRSTLTSIEVNSDASLCSLAPSSELLKLTDGKSISKLLIDGETEIETHIFCNDLNFLITGSLFGLVCVWDLHTQMLRQRVKLEYGVTTMRMGLNGKALVGSTDGAIYVVDVKTGVIAYNITGHKEGVLSLSVLFNDGHILTTSDDCTAKVFYIQC